MLLLSLFSIGTIFVIFVAVGIFLFSQSLKRRKCLEKSLDNRFSVGFFHPFCNAGNGEDRVLWSLITVLQNRYPNFRYIVYTSDTDLSPEKIVSSAKMRFNITIQSQSVDFIYLHGNKWVACTKHPYFPLSGEIIGSIYLGIEAIFKCVPDVFIDTSGYAFTLPLFKYIGGSRVSAYINSISISREMLLNITYQTESYNSNSNQTSLSPILSILKLLYYKVFAKFYSWAGRCSDIVMVNSSWTEDQINYLWACPSKTYKIYPPCCVEDMSTIPFNDEVGKRIFKLVSVAPFRPDKDHPLQIRTLFQLRQLLTEDLWDRIRLTLIGSCRTLEDALRVKDMQDLCKHLSVEDNVIFKINLSYADMKEELAESLIGLHSRWNEPFGISIVESMAAGVIMVANKSGGPRTDIIMQYDGFRNGFLATDELEYAEAVRDIILMGPQARSAIRYQARASVTHFSEDQFKKTVLEAVGSLFF